jgi:signal transduction histidine kinase
VTEAEREMFLDTIAAECDRQIDLVLNLLDLSRIEAGTFNIALAPVDVKEVINSAVTIAFHSAKSRDHQLRAELPDYLPEVLADYKILRRVLCGLVENAIKHTPDRGRITLTASAEADRVSIVVSDTGRGILEDDLPHIFEKFYRGRAPDEFGPDIDLGDQGEVAEAPGVGLGLYLARTIIEEIGGRISVESRVGRGSTFIIHLPVWDNSENAPCDQEEP